MHRKGGVTLRLAIPQESQDLPELRKVYVVKPQQSFFFFFLTVFNRQLLSPKRSQT